MLERIRPASLALALVVIPVLAWSGCASHAAPKSPAGAPQEASAAPASAKSTAEPTPAEVAASHDRAGNDYLTGRELDDAEREFQLALAAMPNDPVALAGLGQVAVARGQYEQAVPLLQRATTVPSQMTPAFLALGQAEMATGNMKGAAAAYRQALALDPENLDARLCLARALSSLGDFDEAEGVCRGAVRATGNDPAAQARAYRMLGEVYSAQGKTPEAVSTLYRASELAPRDVETARVLGAVAARGQLYAEAAAAYTRVLQLAPLDVEAKKQLGWVNFKLGRYTLAISDYEAVSDSLGLEDRYYLAQSYAKIEKADRAAELFRGVARADPVTYKGVYCSMAYAYYDANRYQRAIEVVHEGLVADSASACLRFCWGQALDKLGRHEEAIPVFEAVLNDPAYSESAKQELERQRRIVRLMQSNEKGNN
jgi:tetratricopeptide (TPR) repeat protein